MSDLYTGTRGMVLFGLTASHWGSGLAEVVDGKLVSVAGLPEDPEPSPINGNIASSLNGEARVLKPAVRKSWLENGPGSQSVERGLDSFVEVSWEKALQLLAGEITRVRTEYGNEALFAGSYGWSSAGRFHHAQSQLKRFLNTQGGFVASEGNYSYNAALGLLPYIVGNFRSHVAQTTRWTVVAEHCDLVVMFGGLAPRNTQVSDGGISRHRARENMQACADSGVSFVNISPLRSDAMDEIKAEWLAPLPGSDTAIMMGVAYTLLVEGLYDQDFLARYTTGFDRFEAYLLGKSDGVPKNVQWAEEQSSIPAARIIELARQMAAGRTMITTAAGVQRTDFGEQPLWMTVTLAAMLGQIGLPGGGYTIASAVNGNIGNIERPFHWGALPQGENPVGEVIPVAMISEMLLNPGKQYSYKGQQRTFPDIKLVWWAGGNPFHHHQNLNRLRTAFQRPETIVVNEINWTSTARHADIVLPVAAPQERTDFGAGKSDNALVPMPALVQPRGEARTEYAIYAALSELLGSQDAFTDGQTEQQWLELIWEQTRQSGRQHGVELSDWQSFLKGGVAEVPDPSPEQVFLADFRADPIENSLPTPSGKIELFSQPIDDMKLADCAGHATWYQPRDLQAGKQESFPLYLLSGQPATRLHSQLDNGDYSRARKIQGREPVLIHPKDAASRGIQDGEVVELYNERGCCLAGVKVSEDIRRGCVFLWTGAWYDPDFDEHRHRDRHGNPNVLTHDLRTSTLTQSPAAHSALIEVRKFEGALPEITVHSPPKFSIGL